MRLGNLNLATTAFLIGVGVSGAVSVLSQESQWKGFHLMFVLLAGFMVEKLLGAAPASAHKVLTYSLAAVLHGLVFGLLFLLISLLFPRLSRASTLLIVAVVFIVDIVFLLFASPLHEVL